MWFGRLRTEIGNLRGALSWSLEPDEDSRERADELRLRLVAALGRFWDVQGLEEGKGWLEVALERDAGRYPAVRAKALSGLGWILRFRQDYARAIAVLEEAVVLHKELGDESGVAFALANLGYAVLHGGFRERVPAFVEEGEALMKGDLDGHPRAFLRLILASAPIVEGDLDSAVSQLEESLALCRELGDMRVASISLHTLGMIELIRGNLDRGAATLEEGARITRELKDRPGIAYHAWALGEVNALRGGPSGRRGCGGPPKPSGSRWVRTSPSSISPNPATSKVWPTCVRRSPKRPSSGLGRRTGDDIRAGHRLRAGRASGAGRRGWRRGGRRGG